MAHKKIAAGFAALILASWMAPSTAAGKHAAATFDFTTFYIGTAGVIEDVRSINNKGVVVGSAFFDVGTQGFMRLQDGNIVPVIDPITGSFGLTRPYGINDRGTITGEVDPHELDDRLVGFFFRGGQFTTFDLPGRPGFGTVVTASNEKGDFCGVLRLTDLTPILRVGFVSIRDTVTTFAVPDSFRTFPTAIDKHGNVAGSYQDSQFVSHGFFRDHRGFIVAPIDAPESSTSPGLGTVLYGLNDHGEMSGHFWDLDGDMHGFLVTKHGRFLQIDVPGAQATGGNGLNDDGTVVGSFVDENGVTAGYIAELVGPKRSTH